MPYLDSSNVYPREFEQLESERDEEINVLKPKVSVLALSVSAGIEAIPIFGGMLAQGAGPYPAFGVPENSERKIPYSIGAAVASGFLGYSQGAYLAIQLRSGLKMHDLKRDRFQSGIYLELLAESADMLAGFLEHYNPDDTKTEFLVHEEVLERFLQTRKDEFHENDPDLMRKVQKVLFLASRLSPRESPFREDRPIFPQLVVIFGFIFWIVSLIRLRGELPRKASQQSHSQ
ncbi:MAG: hypothetical protein AAGC68_04655 [Verrucomicrobiota bacterium]